MQRDGRTCHELRKIKCHLFVTDLPGRTGFLLFRVSGRLEVQTPEQATYATDIRFRIDFWVAIWR